MAAWRSAVHNASATMLIPLEFWVDRCRIVRLAPIALALAGSSLVGCASRNVATRPTFANEEQKILACLDLRDHVVDLYASQYVAREGPAMSPQERTAFRDGWAEELAKRGAFDRFEESCFSRLTPEKYECGMASRSTGGLLACMAVSAR
jgi:hypothetical protein